nr:MAG TPA: hypothetical protein [Caudoviricetes sp.]
MQQKWQQVAPLLLLVEFLIHLRIFCYNFYRLYL